MKATTPPVVLVFTGRWAGLRGDSLVAESYLQARSQQRGQCARGSSPHPPPTSSIRALHARAGPVMWSRRPGALRSTRPRWLPGLPWTRAGPFRLLRGLRDSPFAKGSLSPRSSTRGAFEGLTVHRGARSPVGARGCFALQLSSSQALERRLPSRASISAEHRTLVALDSLSRERLHAQRSVQCPRAALARMTSHSPPRSPLALFPPCFSPPSRTPHLPTLRPFRPVPPLPLRR